MAGYKNLKTISFALIAIAALSFACNEVKEIKRDLLDYSLNLMGDKLFAMIEDGPGKTELEEKYNFFKESAINGNVQPDKIQAVSANILNASNSESQLTHSQAEGVLFASVDPSNLVLTSDPSNIVSSVEPIESAKRQKLGKEILIMFEFNEKVNQIWTEHYHKHKDIAGQIHFQAIDGLSVEIDNELRMLFQGEDFQDFNLELEMLEKQDMLNWRDDLSLALEEDRKILKIELKKVKESLSLLDDSRAMKTLQNLEFMDNLAQLRYIHIVDVDSIDIMVKKSLREAGIIIPVENK